MVLVNPRRARSHEGMIPGSPWKPITQVHPVYYLRERDAQDERVLYPPLVAMFYAPFKFHETGHYILLTLST